MEVLWYLDRVKGKLARWYRKEVFREMISCPHRDFSLVGPVTVINRNVKLGKNVTIYPGVMFWGDGTIEIGDNVDIGKDTVIYASKAGGGVHWQRYCNCCTMLHHRYGPWYQKGRKDMPAEQRG